MNFYPTTRRLHSRAGFTLVELLTVIVIVVILIALMFPVIGTMRARAQDAKCKSNLKQLVTAYLLYAQDNRGKVPTDETAKENASDPPASGWSQKLEPYMVRLKLTADRSMYEMFACPSLPEDPTRLYWNSDLAANIHGAVYGWQYGYRKAPRMLNGIANPGRVFVFADWLPGWRVAQKADFSLLESAKYKDTTFRHSRKVNMVFVDGHSEQLASPFPTDINAAPWN